MAASEPAKPNQAWQSQGKSDQVKQAKSSIAYNCIAKQNEQAKLSKAGKVKQSKQAKQCKPNQSKTSNQTKQTKANQATKPSKQSTSLAIKSSQSK